MCKVGSIFVGKYLASSTGDLVVKTAYIAKEESGDAIRASPNMPTPEEREDDIPSALCAGETEDARLELEDCPEKTKDFICDIYFVVPGVSSSSETLAIDSSLGLKLADASCSTTHPEVLAVQPSSPLYQRIFPGDFILGINGTDTVGLSSLATFDLLGPSSNSQQDDKPSRYVKFTIMSSNADGWSGSGCTENSSQGSTFVPDVGVGNPSAVEI